MAKKKLKLCICGVTTTIVIKEKKGFSLPCAIIIASNGSSTFLKLPRFYSRPLTAVSLLISSAFSQKNTEVGFLNAMEHLLRMKMPRIMHSMHITVILVHNFIHLQKLHRHHFSYNTFFVQSSSHCISYIKFVPCSSIHT